MATLDKSSASNPVLAPFRLQCASPFTSHTHAPRFETTSSPWLLLIMTGTIRIKGCCFVLLTTLVGNKVTTWLRSAYIVPAPRDLTTRPRHTIIDAASLCFLILCEPYSLHGSTVLESRPDYFTVTMERTLYDTLYRTCLSMSDHYGMVPAVVVSFWSSVKCQFRCMVEFKLVLCWHSVLRDTKYCYVRYRLAELGRVHVGLH